MAGGGETPESTHGAAVTEDFFAVLGVRPALGRVFSAEDHRPGTPFSVVVIGHGLWQRAYGGDPAILGRVITVLGMRSKVIGVMPAGFAFPAGSEVWASVRALGEGDSRTAHNWWVVGRLRPGVTEAAARQEVSSIARRNKQQYPGPYQAADATVVALATHLAGSVRTPLLVLFGAVGFVLLIVCVNVANLLLVRVTARSRELAVRAAVGAGRWQLIRQLLVESLVLAAAGGALGLLVAFWSMDVLRVLLPDSLPRAAEIRVDGGVIAFALALSAGAGILFGTLPAWRATALEIFDVLKAGARGQTANRRSQRLQGALVVSEVALSLVLLAGAGLLFDSFARLRAVDPGFRTSRVLAANLTFPVNPASRGKLVSQYRDVLERVRSLPGVEAAGTIKDAPFDPMQRDGHFFIEGRRRLAAPDAGYLIVSPGLMEALAIPLRRGRRFAESDAAGAQGVAIVNEEMAKKYWPGRDPIGERVWFDSFEPKEHWLTVVGVAGNVRQSGLTEPVQAQAYVCYSQVQIPGQLGSGNLMVRTAIDPRSLAPAVRRILREANSEAAATFRTMDDVMAGATARQRFQMQVLAAFAALALVLAAVGLYGVMAYSVASNRVAIGIRMALGARPPQLFRMVALRALWLTFGGAAIGVAACLMLRSVLAKIVFGVGPSDPRILAAAVSVMLAVALSACWFPARRAMHVDPVRALREE